MKSSFKPYYPRTHRRWTFLRPGAFMSNALQWVDTIKSQGKVFNPTGDGKVAPGSQLLSTHDQVHTLSKVIGSPIECIDIPAEVAAERMKASGFPEILIQGLVNRWIRTRNSEATFYANEVERLTGQPTQTFETWCYEHRSAFV